MAAAAGIPYPKLVTLYKAFRTPTSREGTVAGHNSDDHKGEVEEEFPDEEEVSGVCM